MKTCRAILLLTLFVCAVVTSVCGDDDDFQQQPASQDEFEYGNYEPDPATFEVELDADGADVEVLETADDEEDLPEDDNYEVLPDEFSPREKRGIRHFFRSVSTVISSVPKKASSVVSSVADKVSSVPEEVKIAAKIGKAASSVINNNRDRRDATIDEDDLQQNSTNSTQTTDFIGSLKETKLYKKLKEAEELLKSPVRRISFITRPLRSSTPRKIWTALGGKQYAVIATLYDGRRFMLVKGNNKGQGRRTVIIPYDHVTDDWTKEYSVFVSGRVLGHLVRAGGDKFHPARDNGRHAAMRMTTI